MSGFLLTPFLILSLLLCLRGDGVRVRRGECKTEEDVQLADSQGVQVYTVGAAVDT